MNLPPTDALKAWKEVYLSHLGPNVSQYQISLYDDPDNDGLANILEFYGVTLFETAFDLEGMNRSTYAENGSMIEGTVVGTDPFEPDEDGDLLIDGFEVFFGLNPKANDTTDGDFDADGLDNLNEQIHGTDPLNPDSNGNGVSDATAVANGNARSGSSGTDNSQDAQIELTSKS